MKLVYVKVDFKKEVNDKNPKFKFSDYIRILRYKNSFAKEYTTNRSVSNKTKHLVIGNELKKLEAFNLSYFRGKNHFEDNDTQNSPVF